MNHQPRSAHQVTLQSQGQTETQGCFLPFKIEQNYILLMVKFSLNLNMCIYLYTRKKENLNIGR